MQSGTHPRKAQTISHAREDLTENGLRARYLDYCAARISEVFLSLSDERTYQLMEAAAREADIEIGSLGFSEMMVPHDRKPPGDIHHRRRPLQIRRQSRKRSRQTGGPIRTQGNRYF